MADLLVVATQTVAVLLDWLALLAIVVGTGEVIVRDTRLLLAADATGHERRQVWLRYARWLVAALTFQLAADVISTAIAPGWDEIGRLAVIALIRTFLNFFLERDLAEVRALDRAAGTGQIPKA